MNKEIQRLKVLIGQALAYYGLETGMGEVSELPLNDQITLDTSSSTDNLVAYAVTKDAAVLWKGGAIEFEKLDEDDIYTLQDVISDEYDLDIPE